MSLMIKGGRVLDPATKTDQIADIYIEDGVVKKIGTKLKEKADETVDASGKYVMPGFIDLHVHLRDPGLTDKETVDTGAAAAAKGGYTTIMAMPNTKPVVDNSDVLSYVLNKGKSVTPVHVYQAGAITVGMEGKELTDMADMAAHGAIAFSEDGKSVMDTKLCREAMHLLAKLDLPFLDHCEEKSLVNGGVINEDHNCERLDLPGIHNTVENVIASRDYLLATEAGARLHLCHCSTKEVVNMLRAAKSLGHKLTAEVCPHHFTLTSDDIPDAPKAVVPEEDAHTLSAMPVNKVGIEMVNYKMNPPLRTAEDRDALIEGLRDGSIDCIATDHAPHTAADKNKGMKEAPFGIVGLETAAALTYTELVEKEILSPLQMAEKMSYNPAKILRLDAGTIAEGADADIVIFDPKASYQIDKNTFVSKSNNTPFHGRPVHGRVDMTIISGEIVYQYENA
ncbi:MAG: dihydroorotase [Eubacterium sp.]|nr:dihydroorotase [Eubacterium sp.]